MKLNVFVKTALFCLFVSAFIPNNCFAQATSPKEGEIYFYQKQKGSEGFFTKYLAVQFQEGSIKVVFCGSDKSFDTFKTGIDVELSSAVKINKSIKLSKDGKVVFNAYDDEEGSNDYVFSQSYKVLEYSFDDFFFSATAIYKLIP